ncbi:ABC transporter ATP-binding protein [Chitinophaga flava]|uniref:ABC transporter ATP-binding protein n=2 Tax=Chitinophaga flava TaxID=2259036 RepID=A0A365XT29_9BACT|nr:ABC transporter ATP-binding protein [Chitinophaga flava]
MRFLRKKPFPFFKQIDQFDCGPACLKIISKYFGRNFSSEHLRDICNITPDGITIKSLMKGAEALGFKTVPASITYEVLEKKAPLPCVTYWRDRHFLVVYEFKNGQVKVADPSHGLITYSKQDFMEAWQNNKLADDTTQGIVLLMEPTSTFFEQKNTDASKGLLGIIPYLRNYTKYIIQIFVGLLMGSIIQLILPFLTQKLVDKGINLNNVSFVYVLLSAQLMLFFSMSFIAAIRSWLLLYVAARINMLISSDYLIKLLNKTVSFFDSKTPGDIVQRINESSRLDAFLSSAPDAFFSYLNAIIFLFALAYYSWTIFFIFTLGIAIYTLWVWSFMKKRAELDFKRFDSSSGMNSKLIQIVGGIQEVKVNGSEKKHIRGWEKVRVEYFKTSVSSLKLTQFQSIGGNVINEAKNILITFTSALLVMDGKITLGVMLAIQYIVGQINSPMLGLVSFFRSLQDARLSMERFNDIDHITPEQELLNNESLMKLPPQNYDIHIKDLNFSYVRDTNALVLKNLNLTIPKGKITAIVGDSGSGKTTLLKLLLKLYLPTSGDITIGDYNLRHIASDSWRALCGTVMQDGYIFSDTITQNITESASEENIDISKLLDAAKIANIEELINSLPAGFNSIIGAAGSSGRTLSGGQRQRILIARAVYKNPEFLFFDEATSALDANNERKIVENLDLFFEGKTVVVIAHRLSTVRRADQIIVLDKGEIKEIGRHEELVEKKGYYHTLIKNQLEIAN